MTDCSERDITRQVVDYLPMRGAWLFKVHGHLGQLPGVPDILACFQGRFLAIEVKIPQPLNTPKQIEGFIRPAQRRQLEAITRAGGKVLVVTDIGDVIRAVEAD